MRALTQSINEEERQNGIRGICICPGDINTPILTWRITLGCDVSLMAGVCGPAYATIQRYTDIEDDGATLKLGLDSDQTDAGLVFEDKVEDGVFGVGPAKLGDLGERLAGERFELVVPEADEQNAIW